MTGTQQGTGPKGTNGHARRAARWCEAIADGVPVPASTAYVMVFERITVDPERMGGLPCIRGMRVTVNAVVGPLAAGRAIVRSLSTTSISNARTSSPHSSTRPPP